MLTNKLLDRVAKFMEVLPYDTIEDRIKIGESIENSLRVLILPLSDEVGIKLALEELNKV